MKKIVKPSMKFSDLETKYQNHFIKEFILAFVLAGAFSLLLIILKQYKFIIALGCILIGYYAYLIYQIYKSLIGKVQVIDTVCKNVEKKETALFGKFFANKSCKIELETEDGYILVQDVPFISDYKTGNKIRIYASENSISQINENTFTVLNPICIFKSAN